MFFHRLIAIVIVLLVVFFFPLRANFSVHELFSVYNFKLVFILLFSIIFCVLAYLEVIDYLMNRVKRLPKILNDQALFVQKDILIPIFSAILLICIYWLDTEIYSFNSIDIGTAAIPLLVSALYSIFQILLIKVSDKPLKRGVLTLFFFTIVSSK